MTVPRSTRLMNHPLSLLLRVFVIASLATLLVSGAQAAEAVQPPLWGSLAAGQYGVGVRTQFFRDS